MLDRQNEIDADSICLIPHGLFITLEGDDGVGKSTQAQMLASWFEAHGRTAIHVHEPGGTQLGEKIRSLLLSKEQEGMTAISELMLFEAARAQVMQEVIIPALERGDAVICDRFVDSTLAYQGFGRELGEARVRAINDFACGGIMPDRTLLLTLDADTAKERVLDRSADGTGDRMESAGDAFRARLRDGFAAIAGAEPSRVHVIDATGTPAEVHARILEDLSDLQNETDDDSICLIDEELA